ncbi:DNA cytosine methyltransferase [Aquimarina algiphila]|uniref:DNA cytosine methyltransferase n=1 Tax=Aquimarina algiphila TaxID=2047982 RepID=UPI00232C2A28|nr:DNA cytosine methyltransferase [Aquimarina algiphila]
MEKGLVDPAPIWTDIKTFDPEPFRDRVHGFIGGYPCQGESHAGKRKLWNDPRFLWPYIEKCIDTIRPLWCYFENVSGHLTGSFPYVLDSLRNMGYSVEAGLFTASEVGAPHERKRLFILAMENPKSSFWRETTKLRNTPEWKQSPNKLSNASGRELDDSSDCVFEWRWKGNEIKNWKQRPKENRELESGSEGSGKELGNSCCSNGRIIRGSQSGKKKFDESCDNGNELSNSTSKRDGKSSKEYQTGKLIENGNKWPARQGQSQYEWEAPRTTQPGMGITVNGYNFRTELLRQYGNGVVSEQAAYAFETLLDKHLRNERS